MRFSPRTLLRNALSICGTKNYTRFVIVTRSRTGSNLLCSTLNSSVHIVSFGEEFRQLGMEDFRNKLDFVFGKQPFFVQSVGFKLFYYHPIDRECPELWDKLAGDKHLRIIHLTRSNLLNVAVSRKLAEKTDRWMQANDSKRSDFKTRTIDPLIHFEIDELEEVFHSTKSFESEARDRFKDHAVLEVTYEDLADDPVRICNSIATFVGSRPHKWHIRLSKQQNRPLQDIIVNFHELSQHFSKTQWAPFFDQN